MNPSSKVPLQPKSPVMSARLMQVTDGEHQAESQAGSLAALAQEAGAPWPLLGASAWPQLWPGLLLRAWSCKAEHFLSQ